MGITKTELRNILNETANYKTLRSRIEELAEFDKIGEEQRTFVEMVTRLNEALAKAAGEKPRPIDPTATEYRTHTNDGLVYRVGSHFIGVNASCQYQSVASIEVHRERWSGEVAKFWVETLGPENVVALAVACVNHIDSEKPE